MDKSDILFRKICSQYDEEFTIEGIVPTEEQFMDMANRVRSQMRYTFDDTEFVSIMEQVRELRSASIGIGVSIDKPSEEHDLEWFSNFQDKNADSCKYNDRFKLYMQEEKHWSEDMIEDLDWNTTQILNRLGDPNKPNKWKRKGLVIGDIQSGKTANYTSVCNKATDAGYKIIIVLAGRTNTLRKQTQKRLESDFIGAKKDDANQKKGEIIPTITVGVGLFGKINNNPIEAFTTNINDFSKKVADTTTISFNNNMMPKLFVLKKNKSVLSNLADWLSDANHHQVIDVPMLLIDDEADDASVNTKDVDSPTAINACIRRILKQFSRSTYLAVTATPFANILINPYVEGTATIDPDLFPDDFIYCLPTPSNYYGSEKLFRDENNSDIVIPIKEKDVERAFPFKHKKTQEINELPISLKDAIRYFAITNATRDILGHNKTHRSMMINVSRFVDVQNRLKSKVRVFWNDSIILYLKAYSHMGEIALNYPEIKEIKRVFDESGIEKKYGIIWDDLQKHLFESNEKVTVNSVNQKSSDSIDYERFEKENNDGMRVIAIGGDCLSRGLTLEGLCVSYFYRNSQMYDTLMQMGRWFGFRPGYDKLVKVWMAEIAVDWYSHISAATEALKIEVYRMNRNKMTPLEFGYKICGHPDALIPTARAKMKNAKMDVAYAEIDVSGHLIECPRLYSDVRRIEHNRQVVESFVTRLSQTNAINMKEHDGLYIKDVTADEIATLISSFKSYDWHYYFDSATLADNIRDTDEKWNVFIKDGTHDPVWKLNSYDGQVYSIKAQKRLSTWDDKMIKVSGSKVRVGAGGCTSVALESYSMEYVKNAWNSLPPDLCMKKDGSGYKDVSDEFILHFVEHPMLFIHYLDICDKDNNSFQNGEYKVISLGLGFPSSEDYETGKRKNKERKKIKVYLNVIAQELSSEEGDDYINADM